MKPLTPTNVNTLVSTLNSIAFTEKRPTRATIPESVTPEVAQSMVDAYYNRQQRAQMIFIFTATREYQGIVIEMCDDHFVMLTKESGRIAILFAHVESFSFPIEGIACCA